jgi:hypothetical protein
VSGRDAFEEEMLFSALSDEDVERLLLGQSPEASQFAEVADFARALRAMPMVLPARDETDFVHELARTARSAHLDAAYSEPVSSGVGGGAVRSRLSPPRLAAFARIAVALAAVPLLFAGLALAHVTLPEPARKAFEAVGVDLPNQPADEQPASKKAAGAADGRGIGSEGKASPRAPRAKEQEALSNRAPGLQTGRGNQAATRGQGTVKANPARAGGRGNGTQGQGRALGKRGLAPGQIEPPGQLHAPGQHKPSGGGKAVGKRKATPPPQSSKPSAPPGQLKAPVGGVKSSGHGVGPESGGKP